MPALCYQAKPSESDRISSGKEKLLKGPPGSEPKAVSVTLTQPFEAERLGGNNHPESLLLPKTSPTVPASQAHK